MSIEFAPDGAIKTQITKMQDLEPAMLEKLKIVQSEIALLSGRVDADEIKVKSLQQKIEETPLGQQWKKKKAGVIQMKTRLKELNATQSAIIQIATGNMNKNMTMSEVFDSLFGEVSTPDTGKKLRVKNNG